MIRLWDGFMSVVAAVLTAAIIGVPGWAAFLALGDELVPGWVWVPLLLLSAAGLVMVLSFLRKAWRGVHPLRERRRS